MLLFLSLTALMAGTALAGPYPAYKYDPNTPKNCNKWFDNEGEYSCYAIPSIADITKEQYLAWNPSISEASCEPFNSQQSYCIGVCAQNCTTTSTTSSRTTATPTPSKSTSGTTSSTSLAPVVTPTPVRAGMVKNCRLFTLVTSKSTCMEVAFQYGLTVKQLVLYNPRLNDDCSGLPNSVGYYVCVGI